MVIITVRRSLFASDSARSLAISVCNGEIGTVFDCSLCALNHSASRHVNGAIHRRVTLGYGLFVFRTVRTDGNPRGWYQPVRSVSRGRSMPPREDFHSFSPPVSSARLIPSHAASARRAIFRGKIRDTRRVLSPFISRFPPRGIFSRRRGSSAKRSPRICHPRIYSRHP